MLVPVGFRQDSGTQFAFLKIGRQTQTAAVGPTSGFSSEPQEH